MLSFPSYYIDENVIFLWCDLGILSLVLFLEVWHPLGPCVIWCNYIISLLLSMVLACMASPSLQVWGGSKIMCQSHMDAWFYLFFKYLQGGMGDWTHDFFPALIIKKNWFFSCVDAWLVYTHKYCYMT